MYEKAQNKRIEQLKRIEDIEKLKNDLYNTIIKRIDFYNYGIDKFKELKNVAKENLEPKIEMIENNCDFITDKSLKRKCLKESEDLNLYLDKLLKKFDLLISDYNNKIKLLKNTIKKLQNLKSLY